MWWGRYGAWALHQRDPEVWWSLALLPRTEWSSSDTCHILPSFTHVPSQMKTFKAFKSKMGKMFPFGFGTGKQFCVKTQKSNIKVFQSVWTHMYSWLENIKWSGDRNKTLAGCGGHHIAYSGIHDAVLTVVWKGQKTVSAGDQSQDANQQFSEKNN